MKKQYRTSRGISIDIEALRLANESTVALGNMKVNAKGDIIDKNGNVVTTSQERVREYNKENPKAIKRVSIKPPIEEDQQLEEPKPKQTRSKARSTKKTTTEVELEDGSIEIINTNEDEK